MRLARCTAVCLVAMVVAASWVGGVSSAAGSRVVARTAPPACILFLYKAYESPRTLVHSVQSGLDLATRLLDVGYEVTIVTDKSTTKSVSEKVPLIYGDRFKVQAAGNAKEMINVFTEWRNTRFLSNPRATPFGLVGFNGHGCSRQGELFFFGTDDPFPAGGVSISGLQREIGRIPLPIVMIVDICQNKVGAPGPGDPSPKPSADDKRNNLPGRIEGENAWKLSLDLILAHRRDSLAITGTKGDVGDGLALYGVSTLYATLPDQVANDSDWDLMACLADGIKADPKTMLFNAASIDAKTSGNRRTEELTLGEAVRYALGNFPQRNKDAPTGMYVAGHVDLSMIVASRSNPPRYSPPDLSLLHEWGNFSGGLGVEASVYGLTFRRVPDTERHLEFKLGTFDYLKTRDTGIDPKGKMLIVDVIAEGPVKGTNEKDVWFQLHPGDHTKALPADGSGRGVHFNPLWNTAIKVEIGKPSRVRVPLSHAEEGAVLRTLAISTVAGNPDQWPPGVAISITKIVLADGAGREVDVRPDSTAGAAGIPLLPRWWQGDILPKLDTGRRLQSTFSRTVSNNKDEILFVLQKENSAVCVLSGVGGIIYPTIPLDQTRYELVVDVEECSPERRLAETVHFVLTAPPSSGSDQPIVMAGSSLTLPVGKSRQTARIPLLHNGVPDYFAITTTSNCVKIRQLEFQRKRSGGGAASDKPKSKTDRR